MTHVLVTDIAGNPNVGLFGFITDTFGLISAQVSSETRQQLEKVLKVPIHPCTIAGTHLIGVFVSGTHKKIIIPSITFDYEKDYLRSLGIPFEVVDTKLTALGNNIVVNEHALLYHHEMEPSVIEHLQKIFEVPCKPMKIHDHDTVGSCLRITSQAGIIHKDARDDVIETLSAQLHIPIEIGTVNQGAPQVASGILANKHGFIIGTLSTGIEITNADEVLGFLK
ncbi:MAG: hypothetical protein ACMXYC_04280 [Candidatus Woesearchaeota archaeon]